ncbi:MAG: lysylphosphatidylglycerol synthase transmembrane domain-containing protein [Dysgonamonadaceae bacterium]|nr:lysylphosphatidylglycerol synthase transmembrane domain-containing protein [Dysgonamonadaceae bacterium]
MKFIDFINKYQRHIIIGFLVFVFLLLARFVSSIDFNTLKDYLYETPGMIIGVIFFSLLSYVSTTFAWMLCMGKEVKKTHFYEVFMLKNVGDMLAAFNPTSILAGDGVKIVYLKKKGISGEHGLSSLLLLRALTIISAIILMVFALLYLTVGQLNNQNVLYIVLLALILIVIIYLIARFFLHPKMFFGNFIDKLRIKTNWSILTDKVIESCYDINNILREYFIDNKGKFLFAFLLSAFQWIFGAMEFYIILNMLNVHMTPLDAIAVEMGVILFKTIGSVVPGQLGIEEYGNKVMLDAIGIKSNEVWLVVSLMRRARQLFWVLVAGIFWLVTSRTSNNKELNDGNSVHHL